MIGSQMATSRRRLKRMRSQYNRDDDACGAGLRGFVAA